MTTDFLSVRERDAGRACDFCQVVNDYMRRRGVAFELGYVVSDDSFWCHVGLVPLPAGDAMNIRITGIGL